MRKNLQMVQILQVCQHTLLQIRSAIERHDSTVDANVGIKMKHDATSQHETSASHVA